ncbi:MAG TPA: Dna2/Cas4 domain-containing protein, partial [Gammaproteobacteria bacterium]|nr:Dna2/Cas4 domain-containing protein [Gammaproteobacteria bacterium]
AAPATHDHNDPLDDFIATLFDDPAGNLQQRARDFAARHAADTISRRLKTFCADSPEQEAQAIALQVRRWLLDDVRPIAIITEDRRLARRVRAMLEASHIELDDTGGWALSTTSAAAMLERWLESVEEDFACGPLLDVLKSPFISFSERIEHLAQVRRLEQDIILHENIARGLARYRHHLERRSARLPDWSEPMQRALQQMLNRLDHAAAPLVPLLEGTHTAGSYLTALHDSLHELGALPCLAEDAAGQRLLDVLDELQQAAGYSDVPLAWSEFRNWLGRNLEQTSFRLPPSNSPVCLLTLEQSRLQRFAASIVAGCSRGHLPGPPPAHTFFNQRVRAQLGLPTWSQNVARKLHHFCRVLHGAQQVLLTRHAEQDGEPVAISPWLELLDVFYHSAWQQSLEDTELHRLVVHPQAQPASPDTARLPDGETRPAPPAPAALQPASWTAYTHQRLIDCPYRYFAADALKLKPREEISEALSKSDYGALVHRIVQAFHSDVDWLPGPWSGPLDDSQRDAALALLTRISDVVFKDAIKDNFQARSWLQQWRGVLPDYLDWEIQRQRDWQLRSVELKAERALEAGLNIHGRIDRVDQRAGGMAVVDYKTGKPPARDAVLAGEAVQLSSYALMLEAPVTQLDYLEIGRDQAKQHTCAGDEELQQLLPAIEQRLLQLHKDLQQQAALPAWGDKNVCGYCEFSGICRRDMWVHDDV